MLRVAESSGAIEEEEQVTYSPIGLLYLIHFGLTNCQEPFSLVDVLKKDVQYSYLN